MTTAAVSESRLPVGSSARSTAGSCTKARATATRCCWPPESWSGSLEDSLGQSDSRERRVHLASLAVWLDPVEQQWDLDVLGRRRLRQQAESLWHEPAHAPAESGPFAAAQGPQSVPASAPGLRRDGRAH